MNSVPEDLPSCFSYKQHSLFMNLSNRNRMHSYPLQFMSSIFNKVSSLQKNPWKIHINPSSLLWGMCIYIILSQEWIVIHNSKETFYYLQSLANLVLFFLLHFCAELYIKPVPLLSLIGVHRTFQIGVHRTFHRKGC